MPSLRVDSTALPPRDEENGGISFINSFPLSIPNLSFSTAEPSVLLLNNLPFELASSWDPGILGKVKSK